MEHDARTNGHAREFDRFEVCSLADDSALMIDLGFFRSQPCTRFATEPFGRPARPEWSYRAQTGQYACRHP
jgi:hypothetical protein